MIVEANFDATHASARLTELRERYDFRPFEAHLTASPEVLRDRYAARTGSRHPGHADVERLPDLETALSEESHPPLGLGGPVVILDTTEFATLDVESVLRSAAAHVGS